MADAVFSISSELPPVVSSSLDGDKDLQDSFAATWEAVDAAEAERAAKSSSPEATEAASSPPVEVEDPKQGHDAPVLEETPKTVKTEFGSSKRKLSETSRAPSAEDLDRDLDGPKEEAVEAPVAEEIDELDALTPHPAASEESSSHFGRLKAKAREIRDELKATKSKLAPVFQELGVAADDIDGLFNTVKQMKSQAPGDPALVNEVEYYRARDRMKNLMDSPTFNREYRAPLDKAFDDLVETIARYHPGDPEANKASWVNPLKTECRPGSKNYANLNEKFWGDSVASMQCDNITKQAVWNKIVALRDLEEKHNQKALECASNPVTLDKLRAQDKEDYDRQTMEFANQYGNMVRDESEKLLSTPEMAPYLKLRETDPKKWGELNKRFEEVLTDYNRGGPRAACKRTIEYIKMQEEVAELKKVKSENASLKRRLGINERLKDAPLRPQNGHPIIGKQPPTTPRLTQSRDPDWGSLGGGN
jgi:hypothetical protein